MVIVFRNEMEIIHGKVEPGVGIGDFKINMSKDELWIKLESFIIWFPIILLKLEMQDFG